jgi:branched-chain amino acid transport system permease protein
VDVDWNLLLQLTVNGVTLGSVYALIALGYSLVYGILKLLNFAHGEVFMVGAFIGWGVLSAFGGPLELSAPVWFVISTMVAVAMLGCGILGIALERFAYRPLRNAPRIAPLISALGASFFLQNTVLLLYGADFKTYDTFTLVDPFKGVQLGDVYIWLIRLVVVAAAVAMMIGLFTLVRWTRFGKAMRATAYDREAASMMGIDVDRVIVITFFVGSALAGAAGVLVGLVFGQINHFMGFGYGLKGFTAAVIGGIGSVPGAMFGGLFIGLAEAYTAGYISSTFQDLIVFCVLVLVMLLRPSGLFGRAAVQKV